MATAIHTPDAGVFELAQAHAAAMFVTSDADNDLDGEAIFEAGSALADEAIALPIRSRHDAAGKLVLLKTLLLVAMGGTWMLTDGLEASILDEVTTYLRADA